MFRIRDELVTSRESFALVERGLREERNYADVLLSWKSRNAVDRIIKRSITQTMVYNKAIELIFASLSVFWDGLVSFAAVIRVVT